MLDFNQINTIINNELTELNTCKQAILSDNLKPENYATIHVTQPKNKKPIFYRWNTDRQKREYLPHNQLAHVKECVQYAYNEKLLKKIDARIKKLTSLSKEYKTQLSEIYNSMPKAKRELVTPYIIPDDSYIERWLHTYPKGTNPYPLSTEILTNRGELVRSKSEKIIADTLHSYNIPYVYEPQLILKSGHHIFPDFVTLNVNTRKTYYWEHFGMLDNPDYARDAVEKINKYEHNHIFIGENLLITRETSIKSIDSECLHTLIRRYLL